MKEHPTNNEKPIKDLVNKGSSEDKKGPLKNERIEDIREAIVENLKSIDNLKNKINKLTQIGPHKEIYRSTRDDAELAFGLTISLISYYSKLLGKITKEDQ